MSASKSGPLRENHNLTFTAPHPFRPSLYSISVEYESDPETQSLTAVSVPDSKEDRNSNIPQVLRRWIDTRLANPLLKLDVSSLCWGINRYWEAAVLRAQIWTKLEKQHSNLVAGGGIPAAPPNRKRKASTPENDSGTLTRSELGHMISHLERSTMLFELNGRDKDKAKGKAAAKVLLSCTLALDEWTSEPHLTPEISVWAAPPNRRVEDESKRLFQALLGENAGQLGSGDGNDHGHAILRATEGVLRSLFRGDS